MVISETGHSTFYWQDGASMKFIRDDADETAPPSAIPLRDDFSKERALSVLRDMSETD